jgi:hypothetical protein
MKIFMDATRCPHCNKRMKVVASSDGRTGFQCLQCDEVDPLPTDAVKLEASPIGRANQGGLKPLFVLPTIGL